MAVAWFVVPMKQRPFRDTYARYISMDDYTQEIYADGGDWTGADIDKHAVVKVRVKSADLLQRIAETSGYERMPKDGLYDLLDGLSKQNIDRLKQLLTDIGRTQAEIDALGDDWGKIQLLDYLQVAEDRRHEPAYSTERGVFDYDTAKPLPCRQPESLDSEVF